jgi:hypothetical protein
LTYHLRQSNPAARFICVDNADWLLAEARREFQNVPGVKFDNIDLHQLSKGFDANTFDLAVCKQTLSWLPGYESPIRELITVTQTAIFVSSLFYDGRIDFKIQVREYGRASKSFWAYYNIYSFPIFREFCLANGAREVTGVDFNIQIDLPRPERSDLMGTYTLKLDTGDRLQVSGALLMPWKIVRIDLK